MTIEQKVSIATASALPLVLLIDEILNYFWGNEATISWVFLSTEAKHHSVAFLWGYAVMGLSVHFLWPTFVDVYPSTWVYIVKGIAFMLPVFFLQWIFYTGIPTADLPPYFKGYAECHPMVKLVLGMAAGAIMGKLLIPQHALNSAKTLWAFGA